MAARAWAVLQIEEAIAGGKRWPASNLAPDGTATRSVHPVTGRSVMINDGAGGVFHVGGDNSGTETIHVYLLDEGVDVWHPVAVVPLGERSYRLPENRDPEDDHWEFAGGSTVIAERRTLNGDPSLVAVAQIAPETTLSRKALNPASR